MSESSVDINKLLDFLKEYPGRSSVEDLVMQLNPQVTGKDKRNLRRNVERRLKELLSNSDYPINNDGAKPCGWYWERGMKKHNISNMDESTALSFLMVKEHLLKALPPDVINKLKPWFEHAQSVINNHKEIARWKNKIRFMPSSVGSPVTIKPEIIDQVYKALRQEKRLEVEYHAPSNPESKKYPINPLGLIFTDDGIYLSCTIKERTTTASLNLNRIKNAKLLYTKAKIPVNYDIDKEKTQFHHEYSDQPIKLVMRVSQDILKRISESPWDENQKITPIDKNWTQISLIIKDTAVLRKKIKSLGDGVVVLKPAKIRKDVLNTANKIIDLYK